MISTDAAATSGVCGAARGIVQVEALSMQQRVRLHAAAPGDNGGERRRRDGSRCVSHRQVNKHTHKRHESRQHGTEVSSAQVLWRATCPTECAPKIAPTMKNVRLDAMDKCVQDGQHRRVGNGWCRGVRLWRCPADAVNMRPEALAMTAHFARVLVAQVVTTVTQ